LARVRTAGIAAIFIAITAMAASEQHHQPTKLQPLSLDQLRREFNAASDRVRVILLLSPT